MPESKTLKRKGYFQVGERKLGKKRKKNLDRGERFRKEWEETHTYS